MAASVLFSLPVVVFFMIIQRNLVSGMSAGAVKG
jgi:N,N'-diacetylchitobiose transport system permease protein